MQRLTHHLLAPVLLAGSAVGQCFEATSLPSPVFGAKGTMFDVVNTSANDIVVGSFDQGFLNPAVSNIEIYTRAGSLQGVEGTPSAWTLLGSTTGFSHGSAPTMDPIPIPINVTIPAGATQAFYITITNVGNVVATQPGNQQFGVVMATTVDLELRVGIGLSYPFNVYPPSLINGGIWHGRIHYCPAGPGTALAETATIGASCGLSFASFYEMFPALTAYDLAGTNLTMTPDGNGGYAVMPGGAPIPVGSLGGTTTLLALGDDDEIFHPFTVGSFPGPNGAWSGLSVISNGKVCENTGNLTFAAPNPTTMLSEPETGVYCQGDWNPSAGGSVTVEESAAVTTVTWENVPTWNVPGSSNNFQFQFHASGQIVLALGSITSVSPYYAGVLVGYSIAGPDQDPGSADLSALSALLVSGSNDGPLTLSPTSRPIIGSDWDLDLTGIPTTVTVGVEIFGLTDPMLNDLSALGLPGCGMRASLDSLNPFVPAGSTARAYSLTVPSAPTLLGMHVYAAAAVFQPGVNAFGAITPNGVDGTIGDY